MSVLGSREYTVRGPVRACGAAGASRLTVAQRFHVHVTPAPRHSRSVEEASAGSALDTGGAV
eukprot:4243989-Prymnesium_polylepis.2